MRLVDVRRLVGKAPSPGIDGVADETRTLAEAVSELLKYITKDCDSTSSTKKGLIEPRLYETICALREGRRRASP